jgi:glycosyltransferase involved in cell wall biosynthesis
MENITDGNLGRSSNKMRKKVLIIGSFPRTHNPVYGGVATSCRLLMQSDFSKIFDVKTIDSTQASNPPPKLFFRIIPALKRFTLFIRVILFDRPVVVMFFVSSGLSLLEKGLMARVANCFKIKVLFFPRSGRIMSAHANNILYRFLINFCCLSANIFLCQGRQWQVFAVKKLGIRKNDTRIVPNWTATSELLALGEFKTLFEDEKMLRLLFVGWLEEAKGVLKLLEALKSLDGEINFSLTIAGRGNAEVSAQSYVKKHNLGEKVTFVGWVKDPEKLNLYKTHDALILPSLAEGMPNALIEALASGLVTLTTNVGNIGDYLEDRKNTIFIENFDWISIANSIRALEEDREGARKIAQNGAAVAKRFFGHQNSIGELIKVIQSA